MAYVVLARKYRPQQFADLVGQEHVTRTLANAIAHNRVHHAYLFCGGRGLGKTTAARLLAKCLVCVKGPRIDPCNVCSECVAVTEGRSVDVMEIDGASNNRVEDVRNLREQVRYLPQTARRKIYIIDEVHMLTGSAFNALLKTLEEPPEHVTFIFATTEVHELPATILSRVSRFDFRRLSSAQLVGHLQHILKNEGVVVEEAGLYTVARAGDGSVRDSLTLLDKVIAFASDTNKISAEEVRVVLGVPGALAVAGLVEAVLARDPTLTLRRFDEVFASGQDLLALALEFLKHLRDLTIVKLCGTRDVLVDASDAEYELLTAQAAGVDSVALAQLFDRFTRVVDALPRTRVPRLVLEMGLLDLVHSDPLVPLGDLIDRLEQISSGTPGTGGPGPARGASHGPARANPANPAGPASRTRADAPAFSPTPTPHPPSPPAAVPAPAPAPPRGAPASAVDTSSQFAKLLGPLLGGGDSSEPQPEPVRTTPAPPRPASPPAASPAATHSAAPQPAASNSAASHSTAPRSAASPAASHSTAPRSAASPTAAHSAGPHSATPPAAPHSADPHSAASPAAAHSAAPPSFAAPVAAYSAAQQLVSAQSAASPSTTTSSAALPTPSRPPAADAARHPSPAADDEPPPWPDDPSWGSAQTAAPRQPIVEPVRPPSPAAAPARASSDPADCGGACPGAPQPEATGLIPFTTLPPFVVWEQFLDRLREHEGSLFAFLVELGLAKLGDGVLRLAGTAQAFARNHLRDQAPLRAHLESLLQQHLGMPFKLELVEGEPSLPDLPSLGLEERRRKEIRQAAAEREVQEHPQIQALRAAFDAQVRSVRPHGAPSSHGL